jgi:PAS domain-containing protein
MDLAVTSVRAMPASDAAFDQVVQRLAERAATPGDLETRLRTAFPRAVVRERGLSSEPRVLYVYRDGRFEPEHAEPWWESAGAPKATFDLRAGTIVAASPSFAELIGEPRAPLAGRRFAPMLAVEVTEAHGLLLDAIRELGEVTSGTDLRRADGHSVAVEFHTARSNGHIEVTYRRAPA